MGEILSRRRFAQLLSAAGGAVAAGFDPRTRSWVALAGAQGQPFQDVPKLDGSLLLDEPARKAVAVDSGNLFHRVPAAVLRPGSAQDIVKMVRYANQHAIKVVMRGQAHARWGQTMAAGGIVIDSSSMIAIQPPSADGMDVQPGATTGAVVQAGLAKDLIPPVLPNCMSLSIGGFLSAGGMGDTSHQHGAFVDNVTELDVVTGDGRLVTCSASRESELFSMVLAGMGQCGIVVRARLRLVPAATHAVLQHLTYRHHQAFLEDQTRMAADGRFDDQGTVVSRGADGSWSFAMRVGKFFSGAVEPNLGPLIAGLRFDSAAPPVRMTLQEYHYRDEAMTAAASAGGRAVMPSPHVAMWIPASAASEFVSTLLSTPAHLVGYDRYSFVPINTRRFTRPLLKVPVEEHAFKFWIFRRAAVGDQKTLDAILASDRELLAKMTAVGGKRYNPYSMVITPREWEEHFGPEVWRRFSVAKKKYDPKHVLSPEPAMFGTAG